MIKPEAALHDHDLPFYYRSFSALDRYFRIREPGPVYLLVRSSVISLARIFDDLGYPGIPFEDAAFQQNGTRYIFHCYDEDDPPSSAPFTVQELLFDPERVCFLDPRDVYRDLRRRELVLKANTLPPLIRLTEAARLVSRYHYQVPTEPLILEPPLPELSMEFQRELLSSILSSRNPEKGLRLLALSGFVQAYWPELQRMSVIPQAKDYHPEGDVWEHTLQTFQYRKQDDLVLSLGLLLHDVGKPAASGSSEKPFDGHAELGAEIASRLLARLGFDGETIRRVCFLVRYHMMPAALKVLPLFRTENLMDSPQFVQLLELYRADSSASYGGPEGYYEACRVYRTYLRHRRNPFRRNDGKKQTYRPHRYWE
jgi:poly(A) polymerase